VADLDVDPTLGAKGMSLILVESDREGFARGRNLDKIGQHSADTSELFFNDVRVPITDRLGVQAECFVGENLGTFLGGIGQGIDPIGLNTIRSAGGWCEIWYDLKPDLHSHVGYSVDDPFDQDVGARGKTYNQFYWCSLVYDLTKQFIVGMEVSSWKTTYNGLLPGDSVRCEFVAKYGF
jgi:hypothetical protein